MATIPARMPTPPTLPGDKDTMMSPTSAPRRPGSSSSNSGGTRPRIRPSSMDEAVHDMPVVRGGVTFAHQDKLPKLPIPDLAQTCQRYLEALHPLQTPREHAETQKAVESFLQRDGPALQEKLKQYAAGRTSYIEQFWYDSYLNFDDPVVLNLNPFFLLEDDPTPARNNQVTRAASLVASALRFVRAVRREELPPDTVRGTPLDMHQYSRLFGTARVPTDHGCQIEQDPDSRHVVVLCHGQFYWFDVLDAASDLLMTEQDLAVNLQTIVDDATRTPIRDAAKGALGVLSTENRKVWSGLRSLLTREPGSANADGLGIVDSALFVVCLDYSEPASAAALCQTMLCGTSEVEQGVQIGTCTNRWYDKLQIIVCKNGSAGINFEHTGVDGHTVLRFASDVYADTILQFARSLVHGQPAPSLWASSSPDPARRDPASFGDVQVTPHKLVWDLIPELQIAVRFAESRLADRIRQTEFACLDFTAYGKPWITGMGFSPDAFVQMALQAAYYGLYGRVECTYEPAMTKVFLHGRTEAVRSVSDEAVRFVQTFWADTRPDAKIDALRAACQRHVDTTRACGRAEGCDRHLYALFSLWQRLADGEGLGGGSGDGDSESQSGRSEKSERSERNEKSTATLPALFADGGWERLNTTILSTSNCGNPALRQFGFGPVSADGFGIGYIIKDNGISICMSSKHRQTKRFLDAVESYLLEIRRILRATSRRSGSMKQSRAREIDHDAPRPALHRIKSRGMPLTGSATVQAQAAVDPPGESAALSEDDELGGYGFFDAGMLLQARDSGDAKPSEEAARRRGVGLKLRLVDY